MDEAIMVGDGVAGCDGESESGVVLRFEAHAPGLARVAWQSGLVTVERIEEIAVLHGARAGTERGHSLYRECCASVVRVLAGGAS